MEQGGSFVVALTPSCGAHLFLQLGSGSLKQSLRYADSWWDEQMHPSGFGQTAMQSMWLLFVSAAKLTFPLSFLNTGAIPRNVPRFGFQCGNKCCVSPFSPTLCSWSRLLMIICGVAAYVQ